jgi:hypothetical protein
MAVQRISAVGLPEAAPFPYNQQCRPPLRLWRGTRYAETGRRRDELAGRLVPTPEAPRLCGKERRASDVLAGSGGIALVESDSYGMSRALLRKLHMDRLDLGRVQLRPLQVANQRHRRRGSLR